MLKEFITFVGGGGLLLAMIGWLIKSLLSHILSKDIQRYKDQLKAENICGIENFKHDLQRRALEHQVRFSKLHEEMATTLAEVYAKLVDYYKAAALLMSTSGLRFGKQISEDDVHQEVCDKANNFLNYYRRRKIYISPHVASKVDGFIDLLNRAVQLDRRSTRLSKVGFGHSKSTDKAFEEATDELIQVQDKLPVLFQDLESEFRRLLGFGDHKGLMLDSQPNIEVNSGQE